MTTRVRPEHRVRLPPHRPAPRTEEGRRGLLGGPRRRRRPPGSRRDAARRLAQLPDAGLAAVPSNTFSLYDHVLDTGVMVGAVPDRFRRLGRTTLDGYFAMARGTQESRRWR